MGDRGAGVQGAARGRGAPGEEDTHICVQFVTEASHRALTGGSGTGVLGSIQRGREGCRGQGGVHARGENSHWRDTISVDLT